MSNTKFGYVSDYEWDNPDEDESSMEVYSQCKFKELCGDNKNLKLYHDYDYYQCWGGGLDGGFITDNKGNLYKVNRSWDESFRVERVAGMIETKMADDGGGGELMFLRIVYL
jgi:hypothetical protein